MNDVTVRPSTREDNDDLTVGDTVFKPAGDRLFIPYTVVDIERKTFTRYGRDRKPIIDTYPVAHFKAITRGETSAGSIDGRFMLDQYLVPCTPDHPQAISGVAFSVTRTLLTLRVESDNLDTDAELARAIQVLEAAGFVTRRGCDAIPDSDVREDVFKNVYKHGQHIQIPIGRSVPHADTMYVAMENGQGSGYTTSTADPRVPVG